MQESGGMQGSEEGLQIKRREEEVKAAAEGDGSIDEGTKAFVEAFQHMMPSEREREFISKTKPDWSKPIRTTKKGIQGSLRKLMDSAYSELEDGTVLTVGDRLVMCVVQAEMMKPSAQGLKCLSDILGEKTQTVKTISEEGRSILDRATVRIIDAEPEGQKEGGGK